MAGVNPENRNEYQTPNHITNVQQFMLNEQYMRDIIAVIEKSVTQNGRALSKVEAKVLNLGKGITDNYNKIAQDLKASGRSNVNKNEAQILKSSLDDLFKEMRHLIQPKGSSGIGKNERADASWAEVARLGQAFADNITENMERITTVMENIRAFQNESRRVVQQATNMPSSSSSMSDMERVARARENGVISEEFSRRLGLAVSNARSSSTSPKDGPNFFTATARYRQDEDARVAYNLSKKAQEKIDNSFYNRSMRLGKSAVTTMSTKSNFFKQLNSTVGMLPGVGKVTGGLAAASKASTAGASILGGAGAALGAIAVGVAAIYKQMKKSSPVLQAVSNLFELAWNLLWMPLGNALGTFLLPMAEDLIEFALLFNELFTDFSFEKLMETYYAGLNFIWGALWDIGNALPDMIFNLLIDGLKSLFTAIGFDAGVKALEGFQEWRSGVMDFLRNLPNKIWEGLRWLIDQVGRFFTNLFDKITKLPEQIGTFFANALGKVLDVGSNVIDSIKSIIPFATGGIVTGPTLGLIGEAGPEAVVPLDKANGIGTTYVININGDVYGVQDLESRIERAIQRTANKAYYR